MLTFSGVRRAFRLKVIKVVKYIKKNKSIIKRTYQIMILFQVAHRTVIQFIMIVIILTNYEAVFLSRAVFNNGVYSNNQ